MDSTERINTLNVTTRAVWDYSKFLRQDWRRNCWINGAAYRNLHAYRSANNGNMREVCTRGKDKNNLRITIW